MEETSKGPNGWRTIVKGARYVTKFLGALVVATLAGWVPQSDT
jgi:hypothetical protein